MGKLLYVLLSNGDVDAMVSSTTIDPDLGPPEWESIPVANVDPDELVIARYRNPNTNFILEIVAESEATAQYYIQVQQPVSAGEYSTTITSHSSPGSDQAGVIDDAETFMTEVTTSRSHNVRCLGVDEWDGGVDFICVYDDELPEPVTDDIATDVATYVLDQDPEDPRSDVERTAVPDPEADGTITLDIFPRSFTSEHRTPNTDRRSDTDGGSQ